MPDTTTNSNSTLETETNGEGRFASVALITAGIPFFIGGALVIQTDTPPSLSPTLGMLSHALWALGITIVTLGVVALLRQERTLRRGLAGYLSVGVLGLGVYHGLQWVTWAYVDVRGARHAEHETVLDVIVVPFGAGHLLMYCILFGTGIALLGWALRGTDLVGEAVSWAGVALGTLTVVAATISLVSAFGGGSDGHALFDGATLLLPVLYLWAMGLGVSLYRRAD